MSPSISSTSSRLGQRGYITHLGIAFGGGSYFIWVVLVCFRLLAIAEGAAAKEVATAPNKADSLPPRAAEMMADANKLAAAQRAKAAGGAKTEADYAEIIKMYEAIVAKYREEAPREAAIALGAEALFYRQVLKDDGKATMLLKRLLVEFPGTNAAKEATLTLHSLEAASIASAVKAALAHGTAVPDFVAEEFAGSAPSLSQVRGRPVVLVFWSIASEAYGKNLAGVTGLARKYQQRGLEVLGINLDQDQNQVAAFMQLWGFAWSRYVASEKRRAGLMSKYGVTSLPMIYLIDADGFVVSSGLSKEGIDARLATMLHGVSPAPPREDRTLMKIPLSIDAAPLVVDVASNGEMLRMQVDTGAETGVLDPSRQALVKSALGGRGVTAADGGTVQAPVFAAFPMQIQSWTAEIPVVILLEMARFSARNWEKLAGVLGMRDLGIGKVFLNYGEGVFEIHTGDWRLTSPECVSEKLSEDDRVPVLSQSLHNNPISFTIDTGSNECLALSANTFTSLVKEGNVEFAREVEKYTASGSTICRQGFFTKGRLMGRDLRGMSVVDGAPEGKGVLGLLWLCGFNLEIDLPHREVRYVYLTNSPRPADIEKMLGADCLLGAGGLQISILRSGGSAEKAGLRRNDVLISIGELTGRQLKRDSVAQLLRSKADSKVAVRYRRELAKSIQDTTLQIPAPLSFAPRP